MINPTKHPLYQVWAALKYRCLNPNSSKWKNYGGRGITVCKRWIDSFENFLEDMGERPEGSSLERINVDGNYEPGNCRWATQKEQQNNKRNNKKLTYKGKTQTIAEWSRELQISKVTLRERILRGWSVERTLSTPLRSLEKN
jgi:hypothetical protein